VKPAILLSQNPHQASIPVGLHHLSSPDSSQRGAPSLGEKTGKHAFFEAREENKALFRAAVAAALARRTVPSSECVERQDMEPQTGLIAAQPSEERHQCRFTSNQRSSTDLDGFPGEEPSHVPSSSEATIPAAFTIPPSFSNFYETHSDNTSPTVQAVPPRSCLGTGVPALEILDMTSAVRYNESKNALASTKKVASSESGRSKLSIHDIIDISSINQPKNNKRKSSEISNVTENEVRMWASSPASGLTVESADIPASGSQVDTPSRLAHVKQEPGSDMSEQRPVKRLKKIAENVGYAALGGAVVGASLFSMLVATAPDFL
jgi:hypothetical protein